VYPLRINGSELPSFEDNVDRLREIRSDTRLKHVAACAQVKGCIHEIDVSCTDKKMILAGHPISFRRLATSNPVKSPNEMSRMTRSGRSAEISPDLK